MRSFMEKLNGHSTLLYVAVNQLIHELWTWPIWSLSAPSYLIKTRVQWTKLSEIKSQKEEEASVLKVIIDNILHIEDKRDRKRETAAANPDEAKVSDEETAVESQRENQPQKAKGKECVVVGGGVLIEE